jgi:hypothetical protein
MSSSLTLNCGNRFAGCKFGLLPVDGHVLPEIDQLQGGADAVRLCQMFRFGPPKQVQHQTADRVGRTAAVVEQFRVIGIARFDHVLREGIKQVTEELDGQGVGGNDFSQRNK